MREVLAMVLRTVGPATIGRYLAFAMGDGIGEEEWDGQHEESARGYALVAHPVKVVREPSSPISTDHIDTLISPLSDTSSDDESKIGDTSATFPPSDRSTPTIRHLRRDETSTTGPDSTASFDSCRLPHFYGFASNKLGEACICWLARWGVDILDEEMSQDPQTSQRLRIWGHMGLPATIIRAVLCSDSFFVRNEMERYNVARRVLDLRRRGWEAMMESKGVLSNAGQGEGGGGGGHEEDGDWEEWEEDELALSSVFAGGIYYTHMVSVILIMRE